METKNKKGIVSALSSQSAFKVYDFVVVSKSENFLIQHIPAEGAV